MQIWTQIGHNQIIWQAQELVTLGKEIQIYSEQVPDLRGGTPKDEGRWRPPDAIFIESIFRSEYISRDGRRLNLRPRGASQLFRSG